jgi:cell division protein FtsQ
VVPFLPDDMKMPAIPAPKPKVRSNRKLLIFLFAFFITVLVVLFFQSSLSRISAINIQGNELVASEEIGQAAQIAVGDRFFAITESTLEKRVAALKMIESAQVTKHFPGMITIQVKEFPRVAFQMNEQGQLEAVLADGASVVVHGSGVILDKPILTGWTENDPNRTELCKTLGELPTGALSDISEIKPEPSDSYPDKIKMYTRSQFVVYTTISYLPSKIENLASYIANMQENNISTGIITMLEVDNHAPFDPSTPIAGEQQAKGSKQEKTEKKAASAPSPSPDTKKTTPKESVKPAPKVSTNPTP